MRTLLTGIRGVWVYLRDAVVLIATALGIIRSPTCAIRNDSNTRASGMKGEGIKSARQSKKAEILVPGYSLTTVSQSGGMTHKELPGELRYRTICQTSENLYPTATIAPHRGWWLGQWI
jgi:hypothetical protein